MFRKRHAVEGLENRVLLSATPTSIAVSASSSSVVYGQAVTLTAAVSASPSAPSEGTVAFFDNGTPLGTAPVGSGVATLDNVHLPVGADLISATYSDPGGAFASSSTAVGPQSTIETIAGGGLPSGLPALDASISPQAVAVDSSGDLFIADNTLNVIFEVNHATGVVTTVAGNETAGFNGDGGPAIAAELNDPEGVTVDSSGHLFIADSGNNRVREVELATGAINTVAGNGTYGFSGDGGPATDAGIAKPDGVAVDSSGDLFIADNINERIREVNHATGVITTVAGNGTFGFSGDGGLATAAQVGQPNDVVVDSLGDLFIADGNRIREVDHATGIIATVAGNGTGGFSGDGGAATAAQLYNPEGIALDSSGNLFISDWGNNRVREVNHATRIITTVAGNGTYGFSGDGGPGAAAELNVIDGIAVDSSGNLFIADTNNRRVREVDLATGVITTAAGNGTRAFSGDGDAATAAEVDSPQNIAVDSSGDLFIADSSNNRVREVNHATGIITTVAGNGTPGFSGDGGLASAAELHGPEAVAVDSSGDLFIADALNGRIREVNLTTGVITTVAGYGAFGFSGDGGLATAAKLSYPQGIAVDSSGDLFFADTSNNRVREVNHATGIITTVAGNGTMGSSGDGGPATAAELTWPAGVAVDSSGRLFIADTANCRIREVDLATGVITTVAGNGIQGSSGDGGPAPAASLLFPSGITVDSSGNLFIADRGNHRIREVNLATGIIITAAGKGTQGFSGDGGPASAAELSAPQGVAVDSSGELFIADTGSNRVREVDQATGVITTVAGGGTAGLGGGLPAVDASISPRAVAVDSSGDLFISDNALNVVFEVNHATGVATIVAGNGTAGFSGDGGPATAAELNNPTGITVDSSGDLYIADWGNNRVREVNLGTGVITTVAGNGTSGFSGDGGPATAAELSYTESVAVDSSGDLFIGDANRIREVDHATGIITTVAGNGTYGFSGDGGPATAAQFRDPQAVAVDSSGNLFIADGVNNRIREVNHATGLITTVAGNGTGGFSGDGGPATAAELSYPTGIAVDSSGDLFISDNGGHIREVDHATGVITTVAGGGTAQLGDGGPATGAVLVFPEGVAVDSSGDVFIVDAWNRRVREVNLATGVIATVAGNGTRAFSGDGGLATAAEVDSPGNVAVDSSGDLFIADAGNNCIREVNHATGVITTVAGNGTAGFSGDLGPATAAELNNPQGIAVDSSGNLFITDGGNSRVREVDHATGVITTVAGNGIQGSSGDAGPATAASLLFPSGVAVDSSGDLFIADTGNSRVREVNLATGVITTVAGNGTQGFSGDGGPATAAEIKYPVGVAVDSSGHLFIADDGDARIREVDMATGIITTAAGGGTAGLGDGGAAVAAEIGPEGIAVDSSGNLFIADRASNRIREINLVTGIITTVAGNGTQGFKGDGGPANTAELGFAQGVAVDSSGDLFIADGSNNRIREVSSSATVVNVAEPFVVNNAVYTIGTGVVSVSAADGLLENDTGPSQLTVTAGTVAGAEGGSFTFHADGSFSYTPGAKFPGFDYAQYTVSDAQGDNANATVNVLSQTGGVVWKFYEQVLHRTPDYAGLQSWINDLSSGGKPGDIAVGFFESDELLDETIGGYYQQYLGRTLDENGLAFWKQQWRATGGPELIKAGFAASPEFNNHAGNTHDGWLTALYQRILNRTPDPSGFQFWQQQLAGGASEFDVALGFFDSSEAYQNDVTGWFNEYLNRAPTIAELQQYATQMTQGKTDRDIEQEITNLHEYGQSPSAAAAGTAERLPDYFQQSASTSSQQAQVAAKDSVFAKLGA